MIKSQDLEPLAKSDFGKLLIQWLGEKIIELSDLDKIGSFEEMVGKKEARKILKELFNFLDKARENKPETKKNEYL